TDEIAPLANEFVGKIQTTLRLSESHHWLMDNLEALDAELQARKLRDWRELSPSALSELFYFLHRAAPESLLIQLASDIAIYEGPGPLLGSSRYGFQADVALIGLQLRDSGVGSSPGFDSALLQILRVLSTQEGPIPRSVFYLEHELQ